MFGRRWDGVLAVLVLLAGVVTVQPASAQIWLEPVVADNSRGGATRAKGAVIWSHGLSLHDEDSKAPPPPYLRVLASQGWHVWRLNRMRTADTIDTTTNALIKSARDLRQRGYRRIALAGQSFGAFVSLRAA